MEDVGASYIKRTQRHIIISVSPIYESSVNVKKAKTIVINHKIVA